MRSLFFATPLSIWNNDDQASLSRFNETIPILTETKILFINFSLWTCEDAAFFCGRDWTYWLIGCGRILRLWIVHVKMLHNGTHTEENDFVRVREVRFNAPYAIQVELCRTTAEQRYNHSFILPFFLELAMANTMCVIYRSEIAAFIDNIYSKKYASVIETNINIINNTSRDFDGACIRWHAIEIWRRNCT